MPEPVQMRKGMQVPRAKMPERNPQERARDFNEVPLGFTPLQAMLEASRCLLCQKETCRLGCPVNIPIKDFMILIANGDFAGALRKI